LLKEAILIFSKQAVRDAATICPRPLQVDLSTLKVVSESRVTWVTFVPILFFLGLCSRLRPDVRDRQTDVRQTDRRQTRIIAYGLGHNNWIAVLCVSYKFYLSMIFQFSS